MQTYQKEDYKLLWTCVPPFSPGVPQELRELWPKAWQGRMSWGSQGTGEAADLQGQGAVIPPSLTNFFVLRQKAALAH